MEAAPLYHDVAAGPEGGRAYWLVCDDDVRIRVAAWGPETPRNGTVLLFPGRTEYAEKYGAAAGDLALRGFATVAIDWRGQGLADRLIDDVLVGHVLDFPDYQRDVAAVVAALPALGLPGPYNLIAHSMGGAIGLRALHEGLGVRAAVFSAPMWGIRLAPPMTVAAWSLSWTARRIGLGARAIPGGAKGVYHEDAAFADNVLTTDEEMWGYMRRQTVQYEALRLGAPSLHWLFEALTETRRLAALPSPDLPCIAALGTRERVVDPRAVVDRMQRWPKGTVLSFAGAEHEIMMEGPAARAQFFDSAAGLFVAHA